MRSTPGGVSGSASVNCSGRNGVTPAMSVTTNGDRLPTRMWVRVPVIIRTNRSPVCRCMREQMPRSAAS
ncbi:Uncharacterised protein [Mycobacteroides abscessus subsp. abscessus]|nr:Uncharacterised protein [Mycobacteroides abscessus subsp. abscessus]